MIRIFYLTTNKEYHELSVPFNCNYDENFKKFDEITDYLKTLYWWNSNWKLMIFNYRYDIRVPNYHIGKEIHVVVC